MTPRSPENPPAGPRSFSADASPLPTCGQVSGHRTVNGELCAVPLSLLTNASGKTECLMHSVPETEKLAITARGAAKSARLVRNPIAVNPSLRTMLQIQAYIEDTDGRLNRGEITERGATARMQIAAQALRAHSENLADRLTELEELVAKRARSTSGHVARVLR